MFFDGKTKRTSRAEDVFFLLLTPVVIIALWQFASDQGWINPSVLPSPKTISLTALHMLANGDLLSNLGVSLLRVAKGYVIGAIGGVLIGIGMGLVRRFEIALTLIFGIIRPVPIIAWVPILILWLGIGETSKVTIIAFGTFFPVLLNTVHGIRSTDHRYIEVANVLEKPKLTILGSIILPSALPAIFTGLRIALGIAWMSVVGAELIAASSGIGYLITFAGQMSQPHVMLVGVFAIGIVGLLIDLILRQLEKAVLKWNVST